MKWNDLSIKEKIGYGISISSFVVGTIVTLMGILLPPIGALDPSILTATGEFLTLTAVLLGVHQYINSVANGWKNHLENFIENLNSNKENEQE